MNQSIIRPNPKFDLVLQRVVDVPPELVWAAWTQPEHVKQWFTPKPWQTVDCEIDLRPGGMFRTTMRSPEGEDMPNIGCYLEIVPNQKLVWTSALQPGFRPLHVPVGTGCHGMLFTAVISMEPHGSGAAYTAIAIHPDEESRRKHEEMGFHQGWGTALDQLVAVMKSYR
jgi:Uncharacterized conserved protein